MSKKKLFPKLFLLSIFIISTSAYLDYYFAIRFSFKSFLNPVLSGRDFMQFSKGGGAGDTNAMKVFEKRKKAGELRKIADKTTMVGEFITALEAEIKNPTSTTQWGEYKDFTGTVLLKRYYMFALAGSDQFYNEKKFNPQLIPFIRKYVKNAQEELNARLLITLGFLKDKSVLKDVIDLMLDAKDSEIRTLAAMAVSSYKDKQAISYLKKALMDPYCVDRKIDSRGVQTGCPVREKAFAGLADLGFMRIPPYGFNFEVYNVKEMTEADKQEELQKQFALKQKHEASQKRKKEIAALSAEETMKIMENGSDNDKNLVLLVVMDKWSGAQSVEEKKKWREVLEKYHHVLEKIIEKK